MNDRDTSKHLFRAIMKGQYKPVKIIVDGGADVNITDDNGQTPLMKAYLELDISPKQLTDKSSTRFKIFQYLLKHGADPTIEDQNGRSVVQMGQSTILIASEGIENLNCKLHTTQEKLDAKPGLSSFIKTYKKCRKSKLSYLDRRNPDEETVTNNNKNHLPMIPARLCKSNVENTKEEQVGCKDSYKNKNRFPVLLLDDINISLND